MDCFPVRSWSDELEVIYDTLQYRLPFSTNRRSGQLPCSAAQLDTFCERLQLELQPWSERFDRPLAVRVIEAPTMAPWHFISVRSRKLKRVLIEEWEVGLRLANELGATEVIYHDEEGGRL